ncbi:STE/STE20/MST protein kinase [Phytophthora nicotianae CJ01A1]|uniref:STE/STE20/MST protein kinase n=2 Tax=Phytophthora nicotianae TaxID=4792 RepID=W2W464_PHYNI|nr:STE/STE20/MST protein kinase [Phytophthora nicotianae CJ01A1]
MSKSRRASYAVTSAELPVLKTLGLEEVDPEEVFELQRKEGAGAFGRVFRACYKKDRTRLAALKVIPVALEAGERGEDIESVRREIQFLRECDHPNVVAFHGAYYKDGALWVAMEHCAGGSVGDIRRVRSLSEREISIIMRGALNGLAYLHSRRKIHRDVKGGNILLTDSGQVKIADFGVSAQLRDTLSRRGSFVGTPYWMSPELIQDSDYDFKADIWSLGITAIELADQKPPLFDEHPMRVLIQIPRNPPPLVAHPEKWSAAFLDFLRFCLRKDPAERPTAVECMQHEFIRREAHIERVFARAERDKEGVHIETSLAVAAPATSASIEKELEDEIAEEISDASSSLSDAEEEASTGLLGETFEFRESQAPSPLTGTSDAPITAKLQLNASASADDLLSLSTDELPALSQKDKLKQDQSTASIRQPATEFKLLPSSAKSPVKHGNTRDSSVRFVKLNDSRTSSDVSLNSLSISSDTPAKNPSRTPTSLRPKASSSPPTSPSVKSSWLSVASQDDPLASIDTVTNARVNRLLSSFSTSTSSPSLAAAMRAYNDQYTIDSPKRNSRRQSFNWRSEAALGSTNREESTRSSGKIFVGDPFRASHDVCVKYNSIQAQYEGAPMSAEWAALHQQFGISLAHMRCRQGTDTEDQVPALIRMLRRELVRHGGLQCKYIYRVSPVQDELQRAKAAINRGSFEPAQLSDPHVYASLLKLWLRELPVLLLDVLDVQDLASITKLVNTGKLDDDDDLHLFTTGNIDLVDAQITRTLVKLGSRENAVFQWLLEHMLEVNSHRSVNHMTTQALATVMAPNVFSCAGMARSTQENAGNLMKQIVLFLRVLLSWRRANLGSSSTASTYLLEQEEKNVAAAFSPKKETPHNGKVSTLQQKVRQSLTKFVKSPENSPESDFVSLETALRSRVDQLWSDLEKSEVTIAETKRQENILRRVFSEFQECILQLIARYSKKSEECKWANEFIERLKENKQLETTMPASLERMKEWVSAALTFEAFCRLLDREQTTQEKLEKLQTRLGVSIRDNQFGSISRSVFNHLSRVHDQQLNTHQSNQSGDTGVDKTLLNGAVRLAARSGTDASSKLHRTVAKLGERQPAIGNLLALLGDCSQNRRQSGVHSLGWLQTQLMEPIPSFTP